MGTMQRHHRAQSNSASRLLPTLRLAVVSTVALVASTALWACDRNGPSDVPPYTEPATEEALEAANLEQSEIDRQLAQGAASQDPSMAELDDPDYDPDDDIEEDIKAMGTDNPQWRVASAACPLVVDNVRVEIEEVPTGAALNFRTTDGDVDELQERVEQMARMYEQHDSTRGTVMWQHHSHMRGGMDQQGQQQEQAQQREQQGQAMRVIPPSTAMVEDLDDGARMVLI